MIGFFDSGIGGLTVLGEFRKRFPDFDYLYFGDRANCPYGGRSDEEIYALTEAGVMRLFEMGAAIVILACNTATVHAIRPLQQVRFPDRKILGVTIPGAEKVVEAGFRNIGILATEGTVRIRAYKERVHLLDDTVKVTEVAAPELVPLIESGVTEGAEITRILKNHVLEFDDATDALVLGCTHFPLIRGELESILERRFRRRIAIVDPGHEAAIKFESYLERHPVVAEKISRGGTLAESYS